MEREQEQLYIRMSQDNPTWLCSEVPFELLEAASFAGEEPTEFVSAFLEAGHTQWLEGIYGRRHFDRERIDRAVLVLWLRACDLYASHVTGIPFPDWGQVFFSDEGLY